MKDTTPRAPVETLQAGITSEGLGCVSNWGGGGKRLHKCLGRPRLDENMEGRPGWEERKGGGWGGGWGRSGRWGRRGREGERKRLCSSHSLMSLTLGRPTLGGR